MLIGAGYIGTEMADALTHRGLEVTIVEMAPAVLTTFDTDLGEMWVQNYAAMGSRSNAVGLCSESSNGKAFCTS